MTQEEQRALADLPLWMVIMFVVASGLFGEMWRAEKSGLKGWDLFRRIALRAGASVAFGMATLMLIWGAGAHILVAAAIGFVIATLGADVASGLYERWIAKKMEVERS